MSKESAIYLIIAESSLRIIFQKSRAIRIIREEYRIVLFRDGQLVAAVDHAGIITLRDAGTRAPKLLRQHNTMLEMLASTSRVSVAEDGSWRLDDIAFRAGAVQFKQDYVLP